MQLTRQSEIAVAMLVSCARTDGEYVHTHDAAAGTGASKEHAAKVAHLLLRAGLVLSARGRNGGIRLARPAERITVGAVLRSTQPEFAGAEPRENAGSAATLSSIVEAGWRGFVDLMDGFSIADLAAERAPRRTACSDCRLMLPRLGAPAASHVQ
jgi:Rrf2 family protein